MEIPEQMDAARLFKDAALKLLTQETHFRATVPEGIAEADPRRVH